MTPRGFDKCEWLPGQRVQLVRGRSDIIMATPSVMPGSLEIVGVH